MKVEIIAEIAQAHDGSLGTAYAYIDQLVNEKVDTVKFQMHFADAESSSSEQFRVNFSKEDATRFDYWKRIEFTPQQWTDIKIYCIQKGINFLCSPFSIYACNVLKNMGEKRIKIASGEISNFLMHNHIASFATEVLISSGMSNFDELDACINFYKNKGIKTAVFQCTTAYPTPAHKVGLNIISELSQRYTIPVGLSDHSGEIFPLLASVSLGATLIEFHAVFHKNLFGPDAKSSLDFSQIQTLVQGIRFLENAFQNPINKNEIQQYAQLKEMFGKSISVSNNLPAGHTISIQDLETKKPANMGINAANFEEIIGKKLTKAIQKNQFLTQSYFD